MTTGAHSVPLVSVITPAYRAARFIEQTIASVRAQSFQNWEMLVVDDASPDGTADLVARLSAAGPRGPVPWGRVLPGAPRGAPPYRKPVQSGASASRNLAIDAARGRWLAFLDS